MAKSNVVNFQNLHFKKENISDREWFIIAATEARRRLRHTQQKTAQPVQG